MSFGVSSADGALEYATHSLDGLFARRRNAFGLGFLERWIGVAQVVCENPPARRNLVATRFGRTETTR